MNRKEIAVSCAADLCKWWQGDICKKKRIHLEPTNQDTAVCIGYVVIRPKKKHV